MVAQGGPGVLGPGDAAFLPDGHHVADERGQLARQDVRHEAPKLVLGAAASSSGGNGASGSTPV